MINGFPTYRFLLILICGCVLSFFAWAALTEIDQQVRGVGKITPSGKIRTIQHLESGIVNDILVKEGQSVKSGDVLFQLANTRAQAEMKEIGVTKAALMIKKARLQAELDNADSVTFSDEETKNYPTFVNAERDLFNARRAEINEKINGLKKRMKQKVLKLDDLEATAKNLKKEREISQEQLSIKRRLRQSGAISHSQYLEVQSQVKSFDTRISKVQKEIPIVKSEISEITNVLEETRQNRAAEVAEELNNLDVDIKKLEERVVTYSDAVSRTAIQAPINGIVNKLHINTIGGVVQSGEPLAEIIAVDEALIVEGRIATKDRGKIWVGLPVAAKITAYDYTIYGSIDGKLTYISADSFIDNQGQSYYQIRAELKSTSLSQDAPVFPGMSVDLNILANKISVLHALLQPFHQVRENALREL